MPAIHPRDDWKALEAKKLDLLDIPVKKVFLTYTDTEPCSSLQECSPILQSLQKNDVHLGMDDIKYNFLITSNGSIYEGRGWFATKNLNVPSKYGEYITVARIGRSIKDNPLSSAELLAKEEVLKYGIKAGYVFQEYEEREINP